MHPESPTRRLAVCSSSGGKDSLLALWHARRSGINVATMLTMFDEKGERSRSHGISIDLMRRQSEAMGLTLIAPSASWASYEKTFMQILRELRDSGHHDAVFGDIDLQPHRDWEERVCAQAGLIPILPLWLRNRRELAQESLALGFRSIVVCTDSRYLSDEFCGREFDEQFLADLPPNVDACGENGEFHTFVYDGPLFRHALEVQVKSKEEYVAPPEFGGTRYCFARLT